MDANLKSRVVTALVGIPLLILIVGWADPRLFFAVFFLLTVGSLREFFVMVFPGRVKEQFVGILYGICLSVLIIFNEIAYAVLALSLLLVLCFSLFIFLPGNLEEKWTRLSWTVIGGLYLGYLLPHWTVLFRLPAGRAWVFFVLSVIMAGDSAAYFIGKRFGAKKLAPEISPGKTVEGALGYIAGSVLAGCMAANFMSAVLSWAEVVALSIVLSLLGQLGDLFESWIKRVVAVKDSGALLPGHGGLLDRLDSLIFPAVFIVFYLKVFRS